MIAFGPRSLILLVAAANGLVLAALLWSARTNRTSNRLLAALLVTFVLRLVPFVIGYAGFYDAYPWLSYAPYNLSLAFGPLLWLYTRALTTGALPARWFVHLLPALGQFAYYAVVFTWSVAAKSAWDEAVHSPYLSPAETLATFAGLAYYLLRSVRDHRALQARLDAHLSNREEFRLDWLPRVQVALAVTLLLWVAFSATSTFIVPLNYFDVFPMYLWWAALVYYLGLGGWRHAGVQVPVLPPPPVAAVDNPPDTVLAAEPVEPDPAGPPRTEMSSRAAPGTDWQEMGARWARQTSEAGYWRDPDLTLASLARALATNTSYLSRALNEGLGESFNSFVNRLRVEAVKRELESGPADRDVLAVGLDAGFRSKASFNRVFRDVTGTTPTSYRRDARLKS